MANIREKLRSIVSSGNVLDDPDTLDDYSSDNSFIQKQKPQFVVCPDNVNEVQAIVKWANETNTPLVPISSGPPHFHGDTVPSVADAVIVDLSRMKSILRIDRRNRMAIIQPGVTYSELQSELSKEGMRLSMPLLPRHNKSIIAGLLEREPILTPRYQRTIIEPLRCLEVIWGNGEKFWTGEAGGHPLSLEEQWDKKWAQVNPMGPGQTDYFRLVSAAQGSMGIVTWASVKCEILPQCHKLFLVPGKKLEDLIDCAYSLLRVRLGDEFFILNNTNLAYIMGAEDNQIDKLVSELPQWIMVIGVTGREVLPEERILVQEQAISGIAQQFGLNLKSTVCEIKSEEVLEAINNPSREPYWKLRRKGGCQDIFFITTLDRTTELSKTMFSVAEKHIASSPEIGVYIQPLHQGVSCHLEFTLAFNPNNQTEITNTQNLFVDASTELLDKGAFFSRPYGIWADMVYSRDLQTKNILNKVKAIFDPKSIMNPGKLCF